MLYFEPYTIHETTNKIPLIVWQKTRISMIGGQFPIVILLYSVCDDWSFPWKPRDFPLPFPPPPKKILLFPWRWIMTVPRLDTFHFGSDSWWAAESFPTRRLTVSWDSRKTRSQKTVYFQTKTKRVVAAAHEMRSRLLKKGPAIYGGS